MIHYYQHKDIDLHKWDKCIRASINGMVYGQSWFLNIVSPAWDALVLDDYRAVMPLTWRKKFGIHYLYQPLFTQQLGVFFKEEIDRKTIDLFFQHIPDKFKYVDICLNSENSVPTQAESTEKVTYQLSLEHTYEQIAKSYNDNTKRNLKKAQKNNLSIVKDLSPDAMVEFKKSNSAVPIEDADYDRIRKVMQYSIANNYGNILGVHDEHGRLCAAAFFLSDERYGIYLLTDSNEIGKKKRAMVLLIDHYIKANCEQNRVLDFEGSVIPGVAFFFKGFGAKPVPYQHVVINKLPWPLSMLKQ